MRVWYDAVSPLPSCHEPLFQSEVISAKSYANKTYNFHKKGSHLGCVPLGNLDLDFKIRISDLQSNAKSKKGILMLRYLFLGSLFTV